MRDVRSATTTLASRAPGAAGGVGNGPSSEPAISADGNRVAFTSGASNFSADDRNRLDDVYVRDIGAGSTELASRASGTDGAPGTASSFDPSLSADGTKVAFESLAGNLDASDPGVNADIYVRDLAANATTIVSRVESGGVVEHRTSRAAGIAANGLRVAFWGLTNARGDSTRQPIWGLFQRDLDASALTPLALGGDPSPDSDIDPVASPIARRKLTWFGGRSSHATDIEVALSDAHGRAWLMRDGRLHRVPGGSAGCGGPRIWLPAQGRGSWRFKLKKILPPGSYVLYSRAIAERGFDTTGVMETTFTAADGNKLRFTVR